MPGKKKPSPPDPGKTARRVARAVVGQVKSARVMETDPRRRKPKHKSQTLDPDS